MRRNKKQVKRIDLEQPAYKVDRSKLEQPAKRDLKNYINVIPNKKAKRLTEEGIFTVNQYRSKFGFSPILFDVPVLPAHLEKPVEVRSKKPSVERESADQAAVIAWARGSSNKWPELKLLYAIPNGRAVHIVTRMKMLREGGLPGMPDLCLPVARVELKPTNLFGGVIPSPETYHALYIEMKSKGKKAEVHQVEIHNLLEDQGNLVFVCVTPDLAIRTLEWYVKLPKISV